MVSFKKLQSDNETGERLASRLSWPSRAERGSANSGQGSQCIPGSNQVSFRDKIPPGEAPPTPIPPTEADLCSCLGDKLDIIAGEIQQTYDSGPPFNARDINGNPRLFTQTATPVQIDASITAPSPDPNIIGFYDDIPVAITRGGVNVPLLWVIADADGAVDPNDPFLYVRLSIGGTSTFDQEVAIRVGEDFGFRNVYQFRIRSPLANQAYRVTSEAHHTTYVSQPITNIVPTPGPSPVIVSTAPVANRPGFVSQNINIVNPNIDQALPDITIPNGFAINIRSNPFNQGNSKIYISMTNATFVNDRNTLASGDSVKLYITNANLVHIASSLANQSVDIVVEQ